MFAGVDVGSVSTEAVLFDGHVRGQIILPSGGVPREAGERALAEVLSQTGLQREDVARIVATGYGRASLAFADKVVTEITCHARGAHYLDPTTQMVIDIGGQDSKVIVLESDGTPIDFAMNEKCAAGTGRFLEVMSRTLEVPLDEMASLARGAKPVAISNVCAVFAESEVVSLLAAEVPRGEICAGLHASIAARVGTMVHRVGLREQVMFTGGVCKNAGVRRALEEHLGITLKTPPEPQIAGALGAAILASRL
jgi:(R)-2-hydroxyacyl-CoA dehydratese activating ATPase